MWEHIIYIAIIAAFALGLRAVVRVLAEGTRMAGHKPFNCDTCLVWWGSVVGTAFIYILALDLGEITWAEAVITWVLYVLAATGIAKHLLRSSAGLKLDSVYDRVVQQMGTLPGEGPVEPCDGCDDEPPIIFANEEKDESQPDNGAGPGGDVEDPEGFGERFK